MAVPLLLSWHERHADVVAALSQRRPVLVAHVALETYSVLTRLPRRLALPAPDARRLLVERFPDEAVALDGAGHRRLLGRLAEAGVVGGAVYDALVAASAAAARLSLATLDRRAVPVYLQMGVELELLD